MTFVKPIIWRTLDTREQNIDQVPYTGEKQPPSLTAAILRSKDLIWVYGLRVYDTGKCLNISIGQLVSQSVSECGRVIYDIMFSLFSSILSTRFIILKAIMLLRVINVCHCYSLTKWLCPSILIHDLWHQGCSLYYSWLYTCLFYEVCIQTKKSRLGVKNGYQFTTNSWVV